MSVEDITKQLSVLANGIPLDPLPPAVDIRALDSTVPHAPVRTPQLSAAEFKLAVRNALRYFPAKYHALLAPEFAEELRLLGHIYMHRFRPRPPFALYAMKAHPQQCYPVPCNQARAMQLMIMNNLDAKVAQFPHELITYGGNGCVFSNWAQYHLVMYYLSRMTDRQTLSMYSGHPMGLFPSHPDAPRAVITNGMVIPNYSSKSQYEKMYALGVSMYGQMTAGSYCYIGPQGIVHGTTITILNAGRKYLNVEDLSGKVYLSSGLGGMSGAQGKAGVISGCIAVIAEVDPAALKKRHEQGWVQEVAESAQACVERIRRARQEKKPLALAFLGNVVTLWEYLAEQKDSELLVDLASDQTSLHNPYNGGYYPVQLSFEESKKKMVQDPVGFKELVQESLRRQVKAINTLAARGLKFWDYGNSFLLEAGRAGAEIFPVTATTSAAAPVSAHQPVAVATAGSASEAESKGSNVFRYPSYVQDIMGNIFSLGFGPFRWVCTSGLQEDLQLTDQIAADVIRRLRGAQDVPTVVAQQLNDNLRWIEQAMENKLVVGSQARILYADAEGRAEIALAINKAIQEGKLKGPVVLSRDHHDVSGTDSPFRETSDVQDGSAFCADMAVQNCIGDAFRGATWVALHNGGGVGWGEVMNGGFGLLLDGTADAARRASSMLFWDVNNGVARRAWGRNANAELAIERAMKRTPDLQYLLPTHVDDGVLDKLA